jgi:hypothetical protein
LIAFLGRQSVAHETRFYDFSGSRNGWRNRSADRREKYANQLASFMAIFHGCKVVVAVAGSTNRKRTKRGELLAFYAVFWHVKFWVFF